jgi:hypothetical protein
MDSEDADFYEVLGIARGCKETEVRMRLRVGARPAPWWTPKSVTRSVGGAALGQGGAQYDAPARQGIVLSSREFTVRRKGQPLGHVILRLLIAGGEHSGR